MSAASLTPVLQYSAAPMCTASEGGMRKSGEKLRNIGVIDPHTFGSRVAQFLRELHPVKTACEVEARTSIPARTVAKWLEGASAPGGPAYHRLIKAYPDLPDYVSPDTVPEVLREVARLERTARLERQAALIRDQLAAVLGGR